MKLVQTPPVQGATTRCKREFDPPGPKTNLRHDYAYLLIAAICFWALETGLAQKTERDPLDPDHSEQFFTNASIPRLSLVISEANLRSLKKNPGTYVPVTLKEDDVTYTHVGVHLKGNERGSFRPLHGKPALTLNFDKFKARQKFHALSKIHLNNSVEDDTYMTEAICAELFRAAGVPAPRVNYARLDLNRRDCGLYVLIEGFNKTFLRRYFEDPSGNLYEGGVVTDINEPLKKSSGNGSINQRDLQRLAEVAREVNPALRWQRLAGVLDREQFLSFMAMEVMTCHWDGYSMNRNNYSVYHDPNTDKMVFFPHGMDVMFTEPDSPLEPYMDGLLARAVLESPEGRSRYRQRMAALFTNVFKIDRVTSQIDELQARIRPVLVTINRQAALDHDRAVERLRARILQRAATIQRLIDFPDPSPLKFEPSGVALVSGWRRRDESENALLDNIVDKENKHLLHIRAGSKGACTASWRTEVLLEPGQYRFEGLVRTGGVRPLKTSRGEGAGLRISRSEQPRPNTLTGNSAWKLVEYEFVVAPATQPEEVELVCELLATKGEAWFELESLRLVRQEKR